MGVRYLRSMRKGAQEKVEQMSEAKMRYKKLPLQGLGLMPITLIILALVGCSTQQPEDKSQASAERPAAIDPASVWEDATRTTIGVTKESTWTNKVELADINGDGLVDVLFANGGGYDSPGSPTFSQVFLNRRSEEHTSELQSRQYLVCRLLLEKKK